MIIWFSKVILIILLVLVNFFVISKFLLEGVGLLDGWLWKYMIDVVDFLSVNLKIFLGWMMEVFRLLIKIVCWYIIWFLVFKNR